MATSVIQGQYEEVRLGNMINPGTFQISYRFHPNRKEEFDDLERELSNFCESSRWSYSPLEKDDFVAVRHSISIWSRGKIEKVWPDTRSYYFADVYLIDYGVTMRAVRLSTCVRPLPDDPMFCLEMTWPGSIEFRLLGLQPLQLDSEFDNPSHVHLMPCQKWTPSAESFTSELLRHASQRAFVILDGVADKYNPWTQPVETGHLHIIVPPNIEDLMPEHRLFGVYMTGDRKKMIDLNLCLYKKNYATISDGVKPQRMLQPSQRLMDLSNQDYRLDRPAKSKGDGPISKQEEEDDSDVQDLLDRLKSLDEPEEPRNVLEEMEQPEDPWNALEEPEDRRQQQQQPRKNPRRLQKIRQKSKPCRHPELEEEHCGMSEVEEVDEEHCGMSEMEEIDEEL